MTKRQPIKNKAVFVNGIATKIHLVDSPVPSGAIFDNRIVPLYLNSEQLAETLGVSVHTIRSWRKLRLITPVKFGRAVRWLLDAVVMELSKRSQSK